jgi:MoaA/NifB/PqqE/SkfB family radical SAM enzyme
MSLRDDVEVLPLKQESGALLVHLLNHCNLRCQHCYMDAAPWRDTFLPFALVFRSLGEAERLGVRTVYLTGGEPFLYPDWAAVLAFAAQQEVFQLVICTNGTRIGPVEAEQLRAGNTSINVSIDGEELYHDSFRGVPGAFRAASQGIRTVVAAGVPVTAVVTICQDNLGCLPRLAEWALEMGIERISVQPLQQVGRGAVIRQKKLTGDQMCDLFMLASDLGYAYRQRGLRFSLNYRSKSYLLAHPCAAFVCNGTRCHRKVAKEIKMLVIKEDGTVLPEIPTLNPRFALGNLREAPLVELVARYFADGYEDFQQLCRTTFNEIVPNFTSPIVPWDEIVSERSWEFGG